MTGSTRGAVAFLAALVSLAGMALAQMPRMLADINPGSASSSPGAFVMMGGRVYFLANTDNRVVLMVVGDGIGSAERVWSGEVPSGGFRGGAMAALDDHLIFFVRRGQGRNTDFQYVSDGTSGGTIQLPTLAPALGSPDAVLRWVRVGDALVFRSTSQGVFGGVWRTDGTAAGTFQIESQGLSSSFFDAPPLLAMNGAAYFITSAGAHRLNRTDGTLAGTTIVDEGAAINQGPGRLLSVVGTRVFYRRTESGHIDIRSTSGTPGDSALAAEFGPESSAGQTAAFRDRLCFVMFTGDQYILMSTDGTPEGTIQLSPPGAMVDPGVPLVAAAAPVDRLFFAVSTNPFVLGTSELWLTDGTPAGTQALGLASPMNTRPIPLGAARDRVYFAAATAASGYELFVTDGTRAGTRQLGDTFAGLASSLGTVGSMATSTSAALPILITDQFVYFRASDSVHGVEPWVVATCPADFNSDGFRDPDDLADFITLFFLPSPPPQLDMAGDGFIDPDDLAVFINVFFQGCP